MDNSCVLPVQQSGSSCFLKKQEWRNKAVSPGRRKTLGFWSCPFVQVLYLIQFKLLLNSLDKMIRMTLFIGATGKKRFDSQKHLEFKTQFQLKSVENLLTLKRQKKKKKKESLDDVKKQVVTWDQRHYPEFYKRRNSLIETRLENFICQGFFFF